MLGPTLTYSCAYFETGAQTLEQAQDAKHDLIARKLKVRPGQKILDIGCGWGGFAKFAAEKYQVSVVGLTVSDEQADLARQRCQGLPVEIRKQDYRSLGPEQFDHIVSVGMFEHVGHKNYSTFMQVVSDHLKDEGLFLLHTIAGEKTIYQTDPFLEKYIFPRGYIPSLAQITTAADGKFLVEDVQNLSANYDTTLMKWYQNFKNNWPKLEAKYGPTFCRMWVYYLLSCAGSFRARKNQVYQTVFSKHGVPGGYLPVR